MKLIMPMAGLGSRFGPGSIKPTIDVCGLPMFVHSERCIGIDFDERIFITRKEHQLKEFIWDWYPTATVIELDELTEGTACTIMMAREHFEDGSSIFISNCDQHIEWDVSGALEVMKQDGVDGLIANFHCPERNTKWSYAVVNENKNVTRVAEKNPISDWATAGYYYWRDGRHFIQSVENMIAANDRVNNEFYTCPTYNYTLQLANVGDVKHYEVERMQGIGTPEDLEIYQNGNCS